CTHDNRKNLYGGYEMTPKRVLRSALVLFVVSVFAASLSAQRAEIYPNAGLFWPDTMTDGQRFDHDGIYGIKGGVFVGQNAEIEGSFGYINHFQVKQPAPAIGMPTRGYLYDLNGVYNFG